MEDSHKFLKDFPPLPAKNKKESDNDDLDNGIRAEKPSYRRSQTEFLLQGRWTLVCDCLTRDFSMHTESHRIMNALRELQKKHPDLFPREPEIFKKFKDSEFLYLYTSNFGDEEQVKASADTIRDNIDFPYTITYFLRAEHYKNAAYTHTPERELYKHVRDSWQQQLVIPADGTARIEGISESSEGSLADNFSKLNILSPSEVTDEEYIFFPEGDAEEMHSPTFGKWMVFNVKKEEHDAAWSSLVPLCQKDILIGLKASTSKTSAIQAFYDSTPRVINCFSKIFEDKNRMKETADAIRNSTDYKNMLYFKTNTASTEGQYRHKGSKNVTKYMHTVMGSLYERDKFSRWKLIVS